MPKPKFVKPLLIGAACTIPVGLVVGLSVNWDHTIFISAVGSGGVKPFIESFGKQYHNEYGQYDVTVEAGGTTFGITKLAQGYTNIGNASCNPYPIINKENGLRDQWVNKKTFTLGWEGLVLMYSLPQRLSQEAKDAFEIVITSTNILPLYAIFSGHYGLKSGGWTDNMNSLWYFATDQAKAQIESLETGVQDKEVLMNTQIQPFERAGGNTGSNASIAFTYYSNLTNNYDMSDMTEEQQDAFASGSYGSDGLTIMQTDDSNSRAWDSFVAADKGQGGSMVYLTTSFIANENNRKEMAKHGYRLAGYLPKNGDTPIFIDGTKQSLEKICSENGYNWYRPINTMIDLNLEKARDFVYWIYFGTHEDMLLTNFTADSFSQYYIDTVYAKGAKPVSYTLFHTMFRTDLSPIASTKLKEMLLDLNASDLVLEETRAEPFDTVYGAMDEVTTW